MYSNHHNCQRNYYANKIHKDKKEILYPMDDNKQIAIYNEFVVNKHQSRYSEENILIFLKQIYDPRSEKNYDWVFATNVEEILLENIISMGIFKFIDLICLNRR